MPKAKANEDDELTQADREREEDCAEDEDPNSDPAEITPVKQKIGESKNNLRNRANWFQKRRG